MIWSAFGNLKTKCQDELRHVQDGPAEAGQHEDDWHCRTARLWRELKQIIMGMEAATNLNDLAKKISRAGKILGRKKEFLSALTYSAWRRLWTPRVKSPSTEPGSECQD